MTTLNPLSSPFFPGISPLKRLSPEPRSSFSLGAVGRTAAGLAAGGAKALTGIDSSYGELLDKQIEMQEQMMLVSLFSNIERTRHETRMAAVRNMRIA